MKTIAVTMAGTMVLTASVATHQSQTLRTPSHVSAPMPAARYAHVPETTATNYTLLILQYCVRCHNDVALNGNLSLQAFNVEQADQNGEIAEKMIRKLTARMMPPPGEPRPGGDTLAGLALELEARLDAAAAANPNPGSRMFQRLNRAEYVASVRDLLGLDVSVDAFLPPDTKSANFDNIADVQMPSATLMEGYLRAAGHITRLAVGDPDADPTSATYKVPRTASQKDRVEGAPFGTRGGLSVTHNFPADGKYVFQVYPHPSPEGELFGRNSLNETIEVSVDGERVAVVTLDRWMSESDPGGFTLLTDSIYVRAGARRVSAVFIRRFEGVEDDLITPIDNTLADTQIGLSYGVTTIPHLQRFTIVGPFGVTGVSDTPARRRIFTCRPLTREEARPCAERIISRLATQAYRRPLNASDLEGLMHFFDRGADEGGGFEGGIRTALQAVLASPHFVFRVEPTPGDVAAGEVYRISDIALASRLSFFLWGTPPDAELIGLAARGELSRPGVLDAQGRRLLADPRSDALATRFAAQWLRLQDLEKVQPDALTYPYFDQKLSEAMRRETELLFAYLVREDRSLMELLTADYTFVNERLARHYGIPNVTGSGFRRVSYPDDNRRGLLGHGSILVLTSHADRTSPVLRGKWVMEVLLGTPPPPPPPGVPDLEATEGDQDGRMLTTRERMELHRASTACRSCHRFMDPIGLALDNFDVTGKWRIKENGMPLDTRGELYDGTPLASPGDLRQALLSLRESISRNFTANLLAYGLGRRVEYYDMPMVRAITREAGAQGDRMSAFILGVVNSPAFNMAKAESAVATTSEGH